MFKRSFNLQDMCLIAVVRDIDLFVFSRTIPQKQVDILFQAYSEEFFSKHKILKNFIDEDCMLWFLNPRLKKVTVPAKFHSEKIFQQLKVIAPGITSLNLHGSKASVNELNSIICCLSNVIHLNFSETSCNDETLACIKKSCSTIQSLNISYCENITNSGMDVLCDSKLSLKNLNILYSGVTGSSIAVILKRMPSLECLKFQDLTRFLCVMDQNECNLTELLHDDKDNSVKVIKACARMCPNLKKLHFVHPVNEKILKACVEFQNLEELKIKSTHRYPLIGVHAKVDVLTPILPISKNLTTFSLSCVKISVLTLVENFENLKNLYLKKVSFIPFEKKDVKITKTNLITLVAKDIDMGLNDANYEAIALLISLSKNVTKLQLNFIRHLPAEMFDIILESMKSLTQVNLDYTCIKISSLNQLFEIPSLDTVCASFYQNQEDISISNVLAKNTSCTLSWRVMYDTEDDDVVEYEGNYYDDNKHYYEEDSSESDAISDQCLSTYSEVEEYLAPRGQFEDFGDELFW